MNTTPKIEARAGLDVFHDTAYGKLALSKFGQVPENFFIYCCGWLGDITTDGCVMEVIGCEFRVSLRGANKGKYSIAVPGTKRTIYLTSAEVKACPKG